FNQSAFNQSQLHRPQVNQAQAYQNLIPQMQNVSQTDFERYVKANDAFLRNLQSQDFEPDPRVPLILEKCFLKTGRALIDVHKGELTLQIGNESITYNLDQTSRYSANYDQMTTNKIEVTDEACEDDFLLFEEANAFLGLEDDPNSPKLDPSYYDPEGDIQMLEAILNSDPAPPSQTMNNLCLHSQTNLRLVKLKRLNLPLTNLLSLWVSPVHCVPKKGGFTIVKNEENELIPTRLVTDCLCNASGTFQRCMLAIFHDMVEKTMEEKSHFMVKEGIVLGHKISRNGIEVDKAKVDVITRLPYPTTVKEKEMLVVVYTFEKFRSYLIMNKCTVHTDHSALKYLFAKKDAKARLLWWVLLLKEFDFDVVDTKGAENLEADHLSRLEKPYENVLDPKEINETFLLETLSTVTFRGDSSAPWLADFANYHAGNFVVKGMSS
nr:reverse transcriptase domain-containing protein [Tanacetum cinerariifolium]